MSKYLWYLFGCEQLKRHEFLFKHGHGTQIASNDPIEDRYIIQKLKNFWLYAVCDGHGGPQCAEFTREKMPVLLNDVCDPKELSTCFQNIDSEFLASNEKSGAVVLCALLDKSHIHVANSGDCRAVVGRKVNNVIIPIQLTNDHDATNKNEVKRIESKFPNIIQNGRIKGLQPFRALGDKKLKIPTPYVTCEPEIFSYLIHPDDEFLVLASDGLWERLSNERVVASVKGPNAATSVVKQALGPSCAMVGQIMDLKAPVSRQYRDDITVLIVFLKNKK